MKRLIYILFFIFTSTIISCGSNVYSSVNYVDDTYNTDYDIIYYHQYYYEGVYRPVILRNSLYYFYYLNNWYVIPSHRHYLIHKCNKPLRFNLLRHNHRYYNDHHRPNHNVRPPGNNHHRPNHNVRPDNNHKYNNNVRPGNNHKPNNTVRPSNNRPTQRSFGNSSNRNNISSGRRR